MVNIENMSVKEYIDKLNSNYRIFYAELERLVKVQENLVLRVSGKAMKDRVITIYSNMFRCNFEQTKGRQGTMIGKDEYVYNKGYLCSRAYRCRDFHSIWRMSTYREIFEGTILYDKASELHDWGESEHLFNEVLKKHEVTIETQMSTVQYQILSKSWNNNCMNLDQLSESSLKSRIAYNYQNTWRLEELRRHSFANSESFIEPLILDANMEHLRKVEKAYCELDKDLKEVEQEFEQFLIKSGLDQYELLSKI